MAGGTATCVDIILAIILPPLGVFLKYGCKVKPQHPTPSSSFDSFALASMQTWASQFLEINRLECKHVFLCLF